MSTVYKQRLVREVSRLIDEFPDDVVPDGDVVEDARAMVAALPRRSEYDELVGPFYDTAGARAVLGVSRQAITQRAERGTLLRVLTRDGRALYPVFQVDAGRVRPEVVTLLGALKALDDVDGWVRAAWFATPAESLGGKAPRAVCTDPDMWAELGTAAVEHAREASQRWSAAP